MKPNYKTILIGIVGTLIYTPLFWAQNFDPNLQKGELQTVLPVPGEKIDHQGIIINPIPQECSWNRDKWIDIANGFTVKDKQKKFNADLESIVSNKKGTKLTIDFGERIASRYKVKRASGAYCLRIDKKGVLIAGYDERGAFYGIQTLKQLMDSPATANGKLPYCEINDYPDLPLRGVVEGFYGTPWSHKVRLSLIDFYGKFKMNTYLYAPKDDPFHRTPDWRLPYPKQEADEIKELVEACKRNYVDFVWAIHPGGDIRWNEEDYRHLLDKFNRMYELGIRHFAVFFDDVWGEGADPLKQTELLNRLTEDFVYMKQGVSPLVVCPSDYTELWSDPSPQGALATYGATTNPSIKLLWTGKVICSDLTKETLNFVNSRIGRPAFFWWNFPVTDYAQHLVLQGPVYGLDTSLTSDNLCGIASNPMEHGEASKLALYGVADYSWNTANYNPIDNWERGLRELMPEAKDAYRTFAIHSCDTETRYRRDESWETETFYIGEWTEQVAGKLYEEFEKIEKVPKEMEKCTNKALLRELRPWLIEFGKLGSRGKRTIELIRNYRLGMDNADFWNSYVQNLMSKEERKNYESHKSGTLKLQPFYENAMDDMGHEFLKKLTGEIPLDYKGVGSFHSANTRQSLLMLDNDSSTFYTSGVEQSNGDWIGVDLRTVRDVKEIIILQGRNSTDDGDYFEDAALEYSEDGHVWNTLTDKLHKQYEIKWKEEPIKARFIRLKRLDSKRTNFAAIRSFIVNPTKPEDLKTMLVSGNIKEAAKAFDKNLNTTLSIDGFFCFLIDPHVKEYILLTEKLTSPLKCSQYDATGSLISERTVGTPFIKLEPETGAAQVKIEGKAEIFEIIKR